MLATGFRMLESFHKHGLNFVFVFIFNQQGEDSLQHLWSEIQKKGTDVDPSSVSVKGTV